MHFPLCWIRDRGCINPMNGFNPDVWKFSAVTYCGCSRAVSSLVVGKA